MFSEQGFLRTSIFATVAVAAFGIVFGLLSGSFSIAFDGAYSLGDAGMTILALWVSSLIVRSAKTDALSGRLRNRFTMGFWHLEPIVLGLNGTLLIAVASYALINGVITILHGGNELRFGIAIVYAVITLAVCLAMTLIGTRVNRSLQSDFIALDVKAWIMSAGITSALLIAFLIGQAVGGTPLAWISPYVDPVVLALVCVVIIPLPIGAVRQALSEILLITPVHLKAHVDRIATETVQREGFLSHRAYAAKVGRATQIELYFIVPANLPPKSIEEWDRIRDQIGTAIGDEGHNRWLTIAFTADVGWAE
ncbi:cation transporter [Mesorhizobium sp.]|uniref:cation diffusion facilitator family transporter n=1 Tax=Mesorhizobium sp. TaxID=1871066 RepID=UPI00121D2140|nr:cation transporter [Mesorhizobium sp.]TIL51573.1 MAG: cation transporter [Mesorhizobium sp.]TIL56512.1 MAG: cation transporter [Mesorhizobium sp.]